MLEGTTLRIIEANQWRILAEEETGMAVGGKMYQITPEKVHDEYSYLKIELLQPKEIK